MSINPSRSAIEPGVACQSGTGPPPTRRARSFIEIIGVAKARLATLPLLLLGLLAGAFIGLGALFFTLVKSDPALGFAASSVLGGLLFLLGLLLVVAGAELIQHFSPLAAGTAEPIAPIPEK